MNYHTIVDRALCALYNIYILLPQLQTYYRNIEKTR